MGRKRQIKDPQEELEAECKQFFDEATNLMKVHNYTKALSIYKKVGKNFFLHAESLEYFILCFLFEKVPLIMKFNRIYVLFQNILYSNG